jgi:hypothetical protein
MCPAFQLLDGHVCGYVDNGLTDWDVGLIFFLFCDWLGPRLLYFIPFCLIMQIHCDTENIIKLS